MTELCGLVKGVAIEVRDAAAEMEKVAWFVGMEENEPIGIFVKAQSRALAKSADLLESAEMAFAAEIDAVRKLGEIELAKVREMNRSGMVLVEQVRAAIVATEVQYDDAFKRQVEKIGERMIGEFRDWRVIRETAITQKSE